MTATIKKPKPPPKPEAEIELEVVGEWTDEHTKVIAKLMVDLLAK